jgi:hypothetical protein
MHDVSQRIGEPANVNFGMLCADQTGPDREQIEIGYWAMNPNQNHPLAEEFIRSFKR